MARRIRTKAPPRPKKTDREKIEDPYRMNPPLTESGNILTMKGRDGLTFLQRRFVNYFDGSLVDAARKAGYSPNNLDASIANLIKNPLIIKAIEKREQLQYGKIIATRQERQAFWTQVMYDPDVSMGHRLRASELLGKSQLDFLQNDMGNSIPFIPAFNVTFRQPPNVQENT